MIISIAVRFTRREGACPSATLTPRACMTGCSRRRLSRIAARPFEGVSFQVNAKQVALMRFVDKQRLERGPIGGVQHFVEFRQPLSYPFGIAPTALPMARRDHSSRPYRRSAVQPVVVDTGRWSRALQLSLQASGVSVARRRSTKHVLTYHPSKIAQSIVFTLQLRGTDR